MRISEEEIDALAFCPDAFCDGHRQEIVRAIKQTVVRVFGDMSSGSDPIDVAYRDLESTSTINYQFVDEQEAVCPFCGQHVRQVNEQRRPVYANVTQRLQRAREAAERRDGVDLETTVRKLEEANASAKALTAAGPRPKKAPPEAA